MGAGKAIKADYLAQRYALDSAAGIRKLLSDYHALEARQYAGDYDAVIILEDLRTAIERAGLTDRQRQALTLVFGEDLTQAKAGVEMGVARQMIVVHVQTALTKIAAVYESWAWRDEGYSLTRHHRIENGWGETKAVCGYSYAIIKHGKWRRIK